MFGAVGWDEGEISAADQNLAPHREQTSNKTEHLKQFLNFIRKFRTGGAYIYRCNSYLKPKIFSNEIIKKNCYSEFQVFEGILLNVVVESLLVSYLKEAFARYL